MALGKREKESNSVSIRRMGSDKTEGMDLNEALKILANENANPQ